MDGTQLAATIGDLHPDVTCIVWSAAGGEDDEAVRSKDVMRLEIEEWVGDGDETPIDADAATGATADVHAEGGQA
jgi:hypothetical protein